MEGRIIEILGEQGISAVLISKTAGPTVMSYCFSTDNGLSAREQREIEDVLSIRLGGLQVRMADKADGIVIEVPLAKNEREHVLFSEICSSDSYKESGARVPVVIGKDMCSDPVVADLASMPNLLIAGATKQGKSVTMTAIIQSLVQLGPGKMRLIPIDSKMVDLLECEPLPSQFFATSTELAARRVMSPMDAAKALSSLCKEMEERYERLSSCGAADIDAYNLMGNTMPRIVCLFDEFADYTGIYGAKEVSSSIMESLLRIAERGAAAGLHMVISTQRPSDEVLTPELLEVFPTRLAFRVPSEKDSRRIIGRSGAERLIGMGDMLFLQDGSIRRLQGAYANAADAERENALLAQSMGEGEPYVLPSSSVDLDVIVRTSHEKDERYDEAVSLFRTSGICSTSYLQRSLGIGYARACRLVDQMLQEGVITGEAGNYRLI